MDLKIVQVADATGFENTKDLLEATGNAAVYASKRQGRNVSVAASSLLVA